MLDREQIAHDVALAYIIYSNLSDNPELTPEDFYQDYQNVIDAVKKAVDKN